MKTISELNDKSWYRALKVIYIGFAILCYGLAVAGSVFLFISIMKAINVSSRVSTEEQKEAGNSLPAQIERIRKYCERKGFDVAKKIFLALTKVHTKKNEMSLTRLLSMFKK
jgi:hypothetical protein